MLFDPDLKFTILWKENFYNKHLNSDYFQSAVVTMSVQSKAKCPQRLLLGLWNESDKKNIFKILRSALYFRKKTYMQMQLYIYL